MISFFQALALDKKISAARKNLREFSRISLDEKTIRLAKKLGSNLGLQNASKNSRAAKTHSRFEEISKAIKLHNEKVAALSEEFRAIDFPDDYVDADEAKNILHLKKALIEKIKLEFPATRALPSVDENAASVHNEKFVDAHLQDKIFDDVNGKSLDDEQRRAVLCSPKSSLAVAGAGAGKTLTICGKVKWLLRTGRAREDEILLLSYSKASASDLARKVSPISQNLKVKTFHSFGLEVLNSAAGKKLAVESQFESYLQKFFDDEISNDQNALEKIFEYFSFYLHSSALAEKKYASAGERFEDLKSRNFTTMKDALRLSENPERHETLKREYVKSVEELVIANFLFANSIRYEYERAYEIDTATPEKRQYTPDFYLGDYKIYIEHYGVDKSGRAPQYSAEEEKKYIEGMAWKRKTHSANGTVCVETFSYEFQDGTIFDNLKARLESRGVVFRPMGAKEISDTLHRVYGGKEFASFFNLTSTFLNLYKARFPDEKNFAELKNARFKNRREKIRACVFLDICESVYKFYMKDLRAQGKIDFDDMILRATDALDKTENFKYKYAIVDEFQDISRSRTRFLQKIIEHGGAKLFAVGDDWQAIYRFAGCDINVFLNFEKIFPDAKINFITATHRNSAELQAIAEPFITANPEQYVKKIKSQKHQENPARIIFHDNDRAKGFIRALREISKIKDSAEVLALARNRFDFDSLAGEKILMRDSEIFCADFPKMKIFANTVHGSKGLESDFVILISAENSRNGFPNKMEDDPLLDLVLDSKSEFEFAEERRLFYVALTRTRSVVFILCDKNRPSVFVKEIEGGCVALGADEGGAQSKSESGGRESNARRKNFCPWCKSGALVLKKPKAGGEFYACENFPYCRYIIMRSVLESAPEKRCPECGDFLVRRSGRYGAFYGCHAYPRCRYIFK